MRVHTVVRAICQVTGDGHFRPPGAPKPLNRFTWNLACLITSTVRSHKQNMVAAENVVHSRAFYPRDVVSALYATVTWMTGWLGGWLAVCVTAGIVSKRLNLS